MKRIFISRELEATQIAQLQKAGFDVIHHSLINLTPIQFEYPNTHIDWIFFYSKNAIRYFFEKEHFNSTIQYGVMGEGSAKYFQELTKNLPDYIADKPGEEIIETLDELLENATICTPQGSESMDFISQVQTLKNHIRIEVYRNEKSKEIIIPDCSHLAFTSPLNAESYFDKYSFKEQTLFAIGATTAKRITEITTENAAYPAVPGIQNMIDLILDRN